MRRPTTLGAWYKAIGKMGYAARLAKYGKAKLAEIAISNLGNFAKRMPLEKRFFARVSKTKGCWLWGGTKDRNGYGQTTVHGKRVFAHRASWIIHNGSIPEGKCVLHHCDTPSCVNPSHLFIGTQADNLLDMKLKGRAKNQEPKGTRNGRAKLTDKIVLQILSDWSCGADRAVLVSKYKIPRWHVNQIVARKIWKHLAWPPALSRGKVSARIIRMDKGRNACAGTH